MIFKADGETVYRGQLLFDPHYTGLWVKGNEFLSFVPLVGDSDEIEKYAISDFQLKGLHVEIFLAKDSDSKKINALNYSDVNGFAEYLATGELPIMRGVTATVIFLKDEMKGKVIDDILRAALHEKGDVLVNIPYFASRLLKMERIPVERIKNER